MTNYGRQAFGWHIGIGAGLVFLSSVLAIVGLAANVSGLIYGALGPLIGGGVNLYLGLALRRKLQQTPNELRLTQEARSFLQELMKQTHSGWNPNHGYGPMWGHTPKQLQAHHPLANGDSIFHQLGKHWGMIPKTPKDVLPKPLHDLLETACFHYNRIFGILEGNRDESAILKIAQAARSGADEAIFSILHHAATMQRFPETISAASRECEGKIRDLKELADGLEKIQRQPASISDRLSYASAMESALEDVRLERMARDELSLPDEANELRDRL